MVSRLGRSGPSGFAPPLFLPYVTALGVGSKKEQPLPDVGGSRLLRREQVPFRIEPHPRQIPEDGGKSSSNKPRHVLQEDNSGLHLANDLGDGRPDPPLVLLALPLAGGAPRLARESRSDEIHDSTPRATVEGGKVAPDRNRFQEPVRHARCQYRGGMSLPLDVTDRAKPSGSDKSEAEGEAPVAGAQLEDVKGMCSHIYTTLTR